MPGAETNNLLDPDFLTRLEQLELASKKMLAGRFKGDRLSRRKGRSAEFADYRNYVTGDDLRFLDWNLFARLERLFLRLFFEEEDLHVALLVDNSGSMDFGTPTKLHFAKQVAAALGFIGLVNWNRVSVQFFNRRLEPGLVSLRGRHSLWRLLDYLQLGQPAGAGRLDHALKEFGLRYTGTGLVIILSDFMDKEGFEAGLRYLSAGRMDLVVLQILSREELEPELTGDLRLVDVEDDDVAEITVSAPLLRRYRENLAAFQGALNAFCLRRGINFLSTSNDAPFDRLVLKHLRQRGLVQ